MTRTQYLLNKLAQEALEVAHRASKAMEFGLDEVQPEQPFNNAERLLGEIHDFEVIRALLDDETPGYGLRSSLPMAGFDARAAKVEKYYQLSRRCGQIQDQPV